MKSILVGERNLEHRTGLSEIFGKLAPDILIHFVANGEEVIQYLENQLPDDMPLLIVVDPSLPSLLPTHLVAFIKSNNRFENIPIILLADQGGGDYYTARASGLATMSFIKPSRFKGWEIFASKILSLLPSAP